MLCSLPVGAFERIGFARVRRFADLISILAVGVALASIVLKGWKRRVLLVGGAVIVSILTNSLRVAVIGALAYYRLSGDLHGPYHILQGLVVAQVGFVALFFGTWVLSRGERAAPSGTPFTFTPVSLPRHREVVLSRRVPLFLTAGILLLAGSYIHFYHSLPVPLRTEFRWFPREMGAWRGSEHRRARVRTAL